MHTRGEWTLHEDTDASGDVDFYVTAGRGEVLFRATSTSHCMSATSEWRSNMRLASAAPDLLDALTDLVGGCGKEGDLYSSAAMDKARAAIKKANKPDHRQEEAR